MGTSADNQVSSFRAPVERAVANLKTWRIFTDYRWPSKSSKSSFLAAIGLYFFRKFRISLKGILFIYRVASSQLLASHDRSRVGLDMNLRCCHSSLVAAWADLGQDHRSHFPTEPAIRQRDDKCCSPFHQLGRPGATLLCRAAEAEGVEDVEDGKRAEQDAGGAQGALLYFLGSGSGGAPFTGKLLSQNTNTVQSGATTLACCASAA